MKTLRKNAPAFLLLIVAFILSCNSQGKKHLKSEETASVTKIEVGISGMTCTGCEQTIRSSVTKLDGISSVKADYIAGKAIVDYNPSLTDTAKIRKAITLSGYKVTGFSSVATAEPVK